MTAADVKRTQLQNAYANNRGAAVAFIDESYLGPSFDVQTPVTAFYLMTAYVIPVDLIEPMRGDLPEVVDANYWHSTNEHRDEAGRERIREFTRYVGEGDEAVVVALQRPIEPTDTNGETARRACWQALLPALASGEHCDPISLAIFEERKYQSQRNADEMSVKQLRRDGLIPRTMQVLATSPSYERLLWLPDVVSFALYQSYGAARYDYAEPFVQRVVVITP